MSEFEVYVFRETPGSPIQTSSILTPRKRPHDFELPKEKVNWSVERDLVAGKTGGRVISEILEQGKARARSPVNKTMQEWHRNKFFEKTLTTGAVSKAFQLVCLHLRNPKPHRSSFTAALCMNTIEMWQMFLKVVDV